MKKVKRIDPMILLMPVTALLLGVIIAVLLIAISGVSPLKSLGVLITGGFGFSSALITAWY